MYNIAIAIGHNFAPNAKGVVDRGAIWGGTTEADTTKKIVDALVKKGLPGFTFYKVPEKLNIDQRNTWVNARAGELHAYFEFHLDSNPKPEPTGVTTFFVSGNTWAEWEARQFQQEYTRITGLKGRGVKGDTTTAHKRLGAIRDIKIFGLLMELGFISNPNDLKTIQEKGLLAVMLGIQKMFAS